MILRSKVDGSSGLVRGPGTRLAELYLNSRRAGWSLLALIILVFASWGLTGALIAGGEISVDDWALIPMMILAAPAAGCVVGVSAHSPFGDVERTVARPLHVLRAGHLGGLILCAALLFTTVLLTFDLKYAWPAYPLLAFLRNLLGYTGFALLGARLFGARLSWLVPFAVIALPLPWSVWSGEDPFSWLVALSALAIGFGAVCLYGVRARDLQSEWGDS